MFHSPISQCEEWENGGVRVRGLNGELLFSCHSIHLYSYINLIPRSTTTTSAGRECTATITTTSTKRTFGKTFITFITRSAMYRSLLDRLWDIQTKQQDCLLHVEPTPFLQLVGSSHLQLSRHQQHPPLSPIPQIRCVPTTSFPL